METAFFFNNVNNKDELLIKTRNKEKISNNRQPFNILSTINLDEKDYFDFSKNFKYNYSYLFSYLDDMKIVGDVWQCLLVTMDAREGILVMNNGYLYPKFTAIYYKEN